MCYWSEPARVVPSSLGSESETPGRKKKVSAATLPLAATKTALKAATNSSLTTLKKSQNWLVCLIDWTPFMKEENLVFHFLGFCIRQ